MVPRLKARHYLCLLCGYEGRSTTDVLEHVDSCHDFDQRKRFGLVSTSPIQDLVARNSGPHRHRRLTIKDRHGDDLSIITISEWHKLI